MSQQQRRPSLPPAQKMLIVAALYEIAVRMKTHQLRKKYPQASDGFIKAKVMALIERGCR